MPLYDLKCRSCGNVTSRFIKLQDFDNRQECNVCSGNLYRLISAPFVKVDNVGYTCPITNEWIGSKQEHRNNLARHGCRLLEDGEHEDNTRKRQQANIELDKKIEESVERQIESMPTDKVERLAKEVQAGFDVQINRI